jgi:hypothetical protein
LLVFVGDVGDAVFAGEPAFAEDAHAFDDGEEGVAFGGEGVFDAGGDFGEAVAFDDLGFFEAFEAFGEGFGADAGEGAFEFAEAAAAALEVTDDEGGPFVADDLRGPCDRAAKTFRGFHKWHRLARAPFTARVSAQIGDGR